MSADVTWSLTPRRGTESFVPVPGLATIYIRWCRMNQLPVQLSWVGQNRCRDAANLKHRRHLTSSVRPWNKRLDEGDGQLCKDRWAGCPWRYHRLHDVWFLSMGTAKFTFKAYFCILRYIKSNSLTVLGKPRVLAFMWLHQRLHKKDGWHVATPSPFVQNGAKIPKVLLTQPLAKSRAGLCCQS